MKFKLGDRVVHQSSGLFGQIVGVSTYLDPEENPDQFCFLPDCNKDCPEEAVWVVAGRLELEV